MNDETIHHLTDPIERPSFGTVIRVAIDRTDGKQTWLDDEDTIWGEYGNRISVGQVKGALAAAGFIEYETEARFEPKEAENPWEQEEPGDWHLTIARIYARQVVEVMEVYDTRVSGDH